MPRGDKTGPNGLGPMTGRRMGTCVGNERAGFNFRSLGRGFANGLRRGLGRNQGNYQNQFRGRWINEQESTKESMENEIDVLKKRLSFLESELKSAN